MYHALLTNRYLTSRVIPLIAVGAVALCVTLVIVVVSVMTGFLEMVKSSGRTLMGDVVIACPVSGIPHYERLIKRLEGLSPVEAAAPVVDSLGILRMPYPDGPDKQPATVQFWGIDERFARVADFDATLHWRKVEGDQWTRLFSDVLHKNWADMLKQMSDAQRLTLLAAALGVEIPPGATLPADSPVRERVEQYQPEQWARLVYALDGSPDIIKRVLTPEQWNALIARDARLLDPDLILKEGLSLSRGGKPAIALGMHVSVGNERLQDGSYRPMRDGYWWMPAFEVTLTTIPVSGGGLASEPESIILPVVNEFMSGVFLIDKNRAMIPLDVAQRLTHLNRGEVMDEHDPTKVLGESPSRVTMVLVRAAAGVTPIELRDIVVGAYNQFVEELARDPDAIVQPPLPAFGLTIKTWEQQQADFIGPVEKERELMRTLFSIVYLVCAALVLSIFWAIVYEKTRDIGILRSIGASRGGIVWIFLRYGLIVGIIGSLVGVGLAYLVIRNINGIHSALAEPPRWLAISLLALCAVVLVATIITARKGRLLPLVLGVLTTTVLLGLGLTVLLFKGVVIWDPSVYYFTVIPNELDMATALTTVVGAILFSLLGAVIPAAKAADTDPVTALRYE